MAEDTLNLMAKHTDRHMNTLKKMGESLTAGMEATMDVASELAQNIGNGGDIGGIDAKTRETLEKSMLKYIEIERRIHNYQQAMKLTTHHIHDHGGEGELLNPKEIIAEKLDEVGTENLAEETFRTDRKYKDLLNTLQPADASQTVAANDDDIAITQQEVNITCPITQTTMVDPVKNSRCGHTYDRVAIMQIIKNRGNRATCPIGGCANRQPMQKSDLVEDRNLRRHIERQKRLEGSNL